MMSLNKAGRLDPATHPPSSQSGFHIGMVGHAPPRLYFRDGRPVPDEYQLQDNDVVTMDAPLRLLGGSPSGTESSDVPDRLTEGDSCMSTHREPHRSRNSRKRRFEANLKRLDALAADIGAAADSSAKSGRNIISDIIEDVDFDDIFMETVEAASSSGSQTGSKAKVVKTSKVRHVKGDGLHPITTFNTPSLPSMILLERHHEVTDKTSVLMPVPLVISQPRNESSDTFMALPSSIEGSSPYPDWYNRNWNATHAAGVEGSRPLVRGLSSADHTGATPVVIPLHESGVTASTPTSSCGLMGYGTHMPNNPALVPLLVGSQEHWDCVEQRNASSRYISRVDNDLTAMFIADSVEFEQRE